MRGSVRIYDDSSGRKSHIDALRAKTLSWDTGFSYFYIEQNEKRLYIEYREYNRDLLSFSDLSYKIKGLLEIDLTNKKIVKYVHFRSYFSDECLLKHLGVEFLMSDVINNYSYHVDFDDFINAIFKVYTNPTEILKADLIKHGFDLQNFPMSEFKRVISLNKDVWQNKVSHYRSIYYYMKHSLDLTMFFKHISKLKKMALVDLFRDGEDLGYKVNMRWSYNRIKLEHDNWSNEIRDKRLLSEENEFLETGYTYPTIDGGELLTSKFALVYEGKEMKHCVGGSGYWQYCKKGISAIYRYQNKESKNLRATIELRINQVDGTVSLNQMQRRGNRLSVPYLVKEKIVKELNGYRIPEIANLKEELV